MKKLQPFPKLSAKQRASLVGGIIFYALANIFHFTLEFSILEKVNLPFLFIIFHMIGVSCGALITVLFAYKTNILNVTSVYFILSISFLISLMIFLNPIYTPFGLFGAGFCIGGITIGFIGDISSVPERGDPKFGGRFFGREMMYSSFIIIIYALINLTVNFLFTIIFFLILFIISGVVTFLGQRGIQIIEQEHLDIIKHLKNRKNLPKLAVAFFHGFFIINSYYAAILIFDLLGLVQYLNSFVLILFLTVSIFIIPAGIIADTIGRRFTVMIGLAIQALAFLILSFLIQINFILIIAFIIILGIGFAFFYIGFSQLGVELPNRSLLRDESLIRMAFLGLGSAVGVLLGEVISQLIETNPAYLTIILLFVFICATIVIFQVRETLPSRSEKFSKPESIDEEDLTLYKERKICLVCKGKAIGFEVYICTECGVLYCLKCAKALSTLENLCWACNAPIDQSKPTKPLEEEQDESKEVVKVDKLK